jgi:hypothetical protein
MKLILKRAGLNIRADQVFGDGGAITEVRKGIDDRPMALHTEDGEMLPRQVSAVLHNEAGAPPRLVVTFTVDGSDVIVQGDQ